MTTSSARPDQLRDHARRLRSAGHRLHDEITSVAAAQAAFGDRCPDGTAAGGSALQANATLALLEELASGVAQVAEAFESADRGHISGVVQVGDARLATVITRLAPGLAASTDVAETVDFERGRRLGIRLRHADPARARAALDHLGSPSGLDPHLAAGLLQGLGAHAIARLAADAHRHSSTDGHSRRLEDHLLDQLAGLLQQAAGTVAATTRPTDVVRIDPEGLDLRLFARLGQSLEGRSALRSLVARMHPQPPAAVAASIADQVLLGPTALDDFSRPGSPLLGGAPLTVPGEDGEQRALKLLAADPLASMLLELRHPHGPSPILRLIQRDRPGPDHAATGEIVRNVLVESVHRGWALPWADPPAGTAHAYSRQPLPRVLDGLMEVVALNDSGSRASASLATALAAVVSTHPQAFAVATARADAADTHGGRQLPARFYRAIAHDPGALDQVTHALVEEYQRAVIASVAAHPPGSAATFAVLTDLELAQRSLRALVDGARAAGRYDRVGVVLGARLTKMTVTAGLNKVSFTAGPVAWGAAKAGGFLTGALARSVVKHNGSGSDGRERDAEREIERGGAYLGAVAMAGDPAWSGLLRSPAAGLDRRLLLALDVGGSDGDHAAFLRWIEDQDPVVADVLRTLPGGSE